MISIESACARDLDLDHIVNVFAAGKVRRKNFENEQESLFKSSEKCFLLYFVVSNCSTALIRVKNIIELF